MTLDEIVNSEIRVTLARRGYTQKWLAGQAGVSLTWVSRRMSGDVSWNLADLQLIGRVLEVNPVALLGAVR